MRIAFAGAGRCSIPPFRALLEAGVDVALAITHPDRPKGRGRSLCPTPLAQASEEFNFPVTKTETIASQEAALNDLAVDVLLVVDFGELVPPGVLSTPKLGAFNLHHSLLPRWRGASPCTYAILNGDSITGVTMFRMVERLDAGPVLCSRETPIGPEETAGELHERLAELSSELLLEAVSLLEKGEFSLKEQDHSRATTAPKLKKSEGLIPWERGASFVLRHIRAMQPWPRSFSFLNSEEKPVTRVNFLEAAPGTGERPQNVSAGEVLRVSREEIEVACGRGTVRILCLQPAGKRQMSCAEFLRGRCVSPGDKFKAA